MQPFSVKAAQAGAPVTFMAEADKKLYGEITGFLFPQKEEITQDNTIAYSTSRGYVLICNADGTPLVLGSPELCIDLPALPEGFIPSYGVKPKTAIGPGTVIFRNGEQRHNDNLEDWSWFWGASPIRKTGDAPAHPRDIIGWRKDAQPQATIIESLAEVLASNKEMKAQLTSLLTQFAESLRTTNKE